MVKEAIENDPTVIIINWYDEKERQKYLDLGGTLEVSALPSVVNLPSKGKVNSLRDLIRLPTTYKEAKDTLTSRKEIK